MKSENWYKKNILIITTFEITMLIYFSGYMLTTSSILTNYDAEQAPNLSLDIICGIAELNLSLFKQIIIQKCFLPTILEDQ